MTKNWSQNFFGIFSQLKFINCIKSKSEMDEKNTSGSVKMNTSSSTLSLSKNLNNSSDGINKNGKFNKKFLSLGRNRKQSSQSITIDDSERDKILNDINMKLMQKRHPLNRDGSIAQNQFRGVKREMLERQTSIIIHSMTIEQLYEELLYELLHNVGWENEDHNLNKIFLYIQEAFQISNDQHDEILQLAKSKLAPELRLDVECIEANDLKPKDPNGLSDPFITMFIESTPTQRYNTSVKMETLNPKWEELFSLPISESPKEETLIVEVYDFDAAETVGEKFGKVGNVKGFKGIGRFMKEIATTATTGKHDNELIGRATIPLKTIPASGMVMWYNLDKKGKTKSQGKIKVRLNFSSEKNRSVAIQEHRHLLKQLLTHELDSSKVADNWWSGKFTENGETVLTQHSAQSGLTPQHCALAQWSVYVDIHRSHPLSFDLFDSILDQIIRPIQANTVTQDEIKLFWDATKKLLPSCFSVIRKMRNKTSGDKNSVKTVTDVLNILAKIAMIEPPEGTDLFPQKLYGWISRTSDEPNWDIQNALKDAISFGVNDWLAKCTSNTIDLNGSEEDKLSNLIKLIQLVRSDLQRAIDHYDKIFQEIMHFKYAKTLFLLYEEKLAEIIEQIVIEVCRNIKKIHIPEDKTVRLSEIEDTQMGTTLFELYLVLKRFVLLGTGLMSEETDFKLNDYHNWFIGGVTNWLDIAIFKALKRIEKAIELDDLIPVDETVKYSSSAVDTLAIFYQIKIFWQQLAWPDAEGSYMFVAKIVDDICRCCVFYADKMSVRVEGLGDIKNVYENKFEVTSEWCLAINNIDYIRQSLSPFVTELGVNEIIANLAECRGNSNAERCADTLKNVIENAMDTEKNKILELIDTVAEKMTPPMNKYLNEGAEFFTQNSNSMDRLMSYLEDSLRTLNAELNEGNFERMLDAIWGKLAYVLDKIVKDNLNKRRPPAFYANLRDTLQIMVDNFKSTKDTQDNCNDCKTLADLQQLLELHGYETSDLIHQYYLERLEEQNELQESLNGMLTIRCAFKNDLLEVEVMSARNLIPMDSNGFADPYVRVHLLPEEKFNGIVKPKTNVQSKTLFPLFDEKFAIVLTPEQRSLKNAVVMFSIKDQDMFGMSNNFMAECFISFKDIEEFSKQDKVPQVHLKLTRPVDKKTRSIDALENRQGDKQAKDFLKKLKQKINDKK